MALKLKPAYADVRIGFHNSSLPLGLRDDIHILYSLAKLRKLQRWLDMFEEVPDQKELDQIRENKFNSKQSEKKSEKNSE